MMVSVSFKEDESGEVERITITMPEPNLSPCQEAWKQVFDETEDGQYSLGAWSSHRAMWNAAVEAAAKRYAQDGCGGYAADMRRDLLEP
jgi:hypothetical protein